MLTIHKHSAILPERLREIIVFLNVTTEDFSKVFEVSTQTVRNWCSGNNPVPLYVEEKLIRIGINKNFLSGISKEYVSGSADILKMIKDYIQFKIELKNKFFDN